MIILTNVHMPGANGRLARFEEFEHGGARCAALWTGDYVVITASEAVISGIKSGGTTQATVGGPGFPEDLVRSALRGLGKAEEAKPEPKVEPTASPEASGAPDTQPAPAAPEGGA